MTILQAKITAIKKFTTKPDGTPLVSQKTGRPYTRLTIKTDVTNDDWLSGFDGAETKNWAVGTDIEIDVTKNGQYSNFAVPKKGAVDGQLLKDVYDNTEQILNRLVGIQLEIGRLTDNLLPKAAAQKRAITQIEQDFPPYEGEPEF